MNKDWQWEGSPKNGFNRRRLERCWNLPDVEDRGVTEKNTTYRNLGVGQKDTVNVETPVERIRRKENQMGYKSRPHREPYWNFWRAVFAGWLIRYPKQIFKGIVTLIFGLFLFGVLVMNPEPDYNNNTTPSGEVRE